MGYKYTQLTQEQTYQIHALLKMEHSQAEIAEALGVQRSVEISQSPNKQATLVPVKF